MRALIFDVDGTISETEEVHRRAFNAAFDEAGLGWHWDPPLYRRLLEVTGGKERIRHFIEGHDPPAGAVAVARIPELHAEKTRHYTRLVEAGGAGLRPGVARLLAEAAEAGLTLAIATTTSAPNIDALLRIGLGEDWESRFAVIGAGDVVAHKKPAPDIYVFVLDRLGLPASACVAFEDSRNGLRSALAAGIATVVTPSVFTDDQDFSGALAVVSDLGEPDAPYRHLAGAGAAEPMVTAAALVRWLG